MHINIFTGEPRQLIPTAVGVLSTLGRAIPLEILALTQEESLTLSELARAIKTSKAVVHKYITMLMFAGFLSNGDGRPLPQQFFRHHLTKPLIAEVTGMGFTYAPADGLIFYVDYHDGERTTGIIFPRVEKSDTQLRVLNVSSENVVRVFHDLLYIGSFGQGYPIKIGEEKFSLEAVTSTFKTDATRLEVRLAGRGEPIVAIHEFSNYRVPSNAPGTFYLSKSK